MTDLTFPLNPQLDSLAYVNNIVWKWDGLRWNRLTGSTGYTGSSGYIGSSGTNGTIGYTGSAGINGTIGYTGSTGSINLQENIITPASYSTSTILYFNCATCRIFDVSPTSNFLASLNNVNLGNPNITNIVFLLNQGTTAYIPTSIIIDGSASQTILWQGGSAPSGNANKKDFISLSIYKKTSSTFLIFGQLISFG